MVNHLTKLNEGGFTLAHSLRAQCPARQESMWVRAGVAVGPEHMDKAEGHIASRVKHQGEDYAGAQLSTSETTKESRPWNCISKIRE